MTDASRPDLCAIEQRVCDIASQQLEIPRHDVQPASRLIEDLACDSLDLVELIMAIEDTFQVELPNSPTNPIGKSIFTRSPFRLRDLAEAVHLSLGSGQSDRRNRGACKAPQRDGSHVPFSQLSGRWQADSPENVKPLFEPFESAGIDRWFRRRTDGMRCVQLPSTNLIIGSDRIGVHPDEQPAHSLWLDSFLIDAEPVSTTAYCRFLNSVPATNENLIDWFQLDPSDDRIDQMPIVTKAGAWRPVAGAETLPMVLVSWFGANAYSLWANGLAWNSYRFLDGCLPSEAQWEYAAQGAFPEQTSAEPTFIFGQHVRGTRYKASTMPMAPVHVPLGLSAFGMHHMAGNVWQWCRDWYANDFYQRPESRTANPVNTQPSGVRSERGGSWVGPVELCRPTCRRGRAPTARGRCLGFRCISPVELTSK